MTRFLAASQSFGHICENLLWLCLNALQADAFVEEDRGCFEPGLVFLLTELRLACPGNRPARELRQKLDREAR